MDDRLWKSYREKHIKELVASLGHPENNRELALKYVEKCGGYSIDKIPQKAKPALREMTADGQDGLKGFCRVYPRSNQDVMAVFSNPKLEVGENFRSKDNYRLSKTNDMGEREQICAKTSYLANRGDWQSRKAREALRTLAASASDSDLVQMPIPEDKETLKRHAHENIYYTNLYKFASKEQGDIPDWAIQTGLATDLIDEEIGSVQPSAIVVFGSPAWKRCFRKRAIPTDYAAERLNKSPADTNITEVAGLPFHDDSLDSVIIPLTHITSRISDAERETNWQKVQHT